MGDERIPWTQGRRFEFIEWKLFWDGSLNRSDLEQAFDVSTAQASVDLRRYRELAGDNIEYDATGKAFRGTAAMVPRVLRVSADRLLIQLKAWLTGALPRDELWYRDMPPVDMAPDVARHVDPQTLQAILRAIRAKEAVEVRYQSLTNSRWRRIAPHSLAFDGYRWHLRAWACDREDFRDFVLSRIDGLGGISPVEYDPSDDVEWNTKVVLDLRPHHGLNDEQSLAVQRDFGMHEGRRAVEVRLSMAYYFIKRMNLDLHDLPPARAQIELANAEEVGAAIAEARAEAARRSARRRTSGASQGG